ncbi:MAG TPA: carboxypeptidase-like regulatory domain-containing protein [Bacteroidales bacterium]|nr:carboxypeptidase-like regulatory domain-containing protein [Bacteroidales bacterium]
MKRVKFSPAILLIALIAFSPKQVLKAQDLKSAISLTRSEQYDQAAAMLQDLIKKEPANGKNYFYLGENIIADYYSDTISNSLEVAARDAKNMYQKGVEANANEPLNYVGLAKVALIQNDDKTADEMRTKARSFLMPYKKVSKKMVPPAPEYAFVLAKVAESYIDNSKATVDTSKALPLIREAIMIDNKNPDIYLIGGDIFILKNAGTPAIAMYNQAQMADPTSPTAAMKIGNIYVKGRAWQPAISSFEEAINLNENYAPAYRELGQVYLLAQRFEQAKTYFEKYLQLTAGNIPAKIRYVNALFYAKDYEGVIKNVEEIFKVDQSRAYMNRIAGYSSYEKNPPDYNQALAYMEKLFETVSPDRILWKDYLYLARIYVKRNAGYSKLNEELNTLKQQLEKEKGRSSTASAAEKAKIKAGMADLENKIADVEKQVQQANQEIDKAFVAYNKVLEYRPNDRAILNEMGNQYYSFRRYSDAARIYAKLLDPSKENLDELMRIGRTYYTGENYKAADSVFTAITKSHPDYVPAYLWIANTYSKMDADGSLGLAKPKFDKVLQVAAKDSVANSSAMIDAITYLGYYYMSHDNFGQAKEYYNRLVNLSDNKDVKVRGYNSLGSLELQATKTEKTNEGRLPYLQRATESYNKVLALDPNNNYAKSQLNYVREFEAQIKKGINPNEIKGTVKNGAGEPIAFASIRVKDTAAENLTNAKGEFKFEIPQSSETLIVSAKGYKTVEIPITKSRTYPITLEQ